MHPLHIGGLGRAKCFNYLLILLVNLLHIASVWVSLTSSCFELIISLSDPEVATFSPPFKLQSCMFSQSTASRGSLSPAASFCLYQHPKGLFPVVTLLHLTLYPTILSSSWQLNLSAVCLCLFLDIPYMKFSTVSVCTFWSFLILLPFHITVSPFIWRIFS